MPNDGRLPKLLRPLDDRYVSDRPGRQRWVALPVERADLSEPDRLLRALAPVLLRKCDAIDSVPTSDPPEVLSPAEMRRRDPGAALWRPLSWWVLFHVRQQDDGDRAEVTVDGRDPDEGGTA